MESTKQNEAADPRYPETPIGIVRSRDAFLHDLPALLANPKCDRWSVAYCGDERIALAESLAYVTGVCRDRGLRDDECFIGCVAPQDEEDEEIKGGLSFVEYDDDTETFLGPAID